MQSTALNKFAPGHSLRSLPSKKALQSVVSRDAEQLPADSVSFSAAAHQPQGAGALKKIGYGAAAVVALGGAFLAGSYLTSQPEPTIESQFENFGRDLRRGAEDFSREVDRAKEDFETGFQRGMQDAERPPSDRELIRRDVEDASKEFRRNADDYARQQGRKIGDWWNSITKD